MAGEIDAYNTSAAGKKSAAEAEAASSSATGTSNDDDDLFIYNQLSKSFHPAFAEDKLEKELNISCMDCRVPLVPFEEFYNEPLSDAIQMDRDYLSYKNLSLDPLDGRKCNCGKNKTFVYFVNVLFNSKFPADHHFSFMLYSFILTPATKVIALYYDSRIRMYSERNSSLYSLLNYFGDGNEVGARPDLKLKVRRDNIVNDALIGVSCLC